MPTDATPTTHIHDPKWLAMVREDLDTDADEWVVRTSPDGISKLNAIGAYLDTILTELGIEGRLHGCPDCGRKHLRADQ